MAFIPGTIQIPLLSGTPVAPPVGSDILYVKTDQVLYLQDSNGVEYPFGSTNVITALTGDVSATGPGSAVATVNFVGGSSASAVNSATVLANAATALNTASAIVRRDSSGNFAAGTITANLTGTATNATNAVTAVNFSGSLSGDVTGTQSSTSISSATVTGKLLTGFVTGINTPITASDSILTAFENLQAQVSATGGAAITALTGDVTATGPGSVAATVAFVGGSTASAVNSATVLANNSTSLNTASQIVRRDASGNFAAGTITANLSGNATTATTATNFSGSLSGDVTGTQSATVVSFVDSYSAAAVGQSVADTQAATSINTASTIVKRDASGNFAAGTITANLTGTATNATNATTAVNFSGSLSGDVTGTQTTTSIASTVVTGKLLTGYVTGINTPITATDSILTAFENLQAQVSAGAGSAITSLTGDATATGPGAATLTLATVNSNIGSFGSSTAIPSFTVNAKGLITAASTSAVIAPAGTLTGTTLASNVVTSSLTAVGTITTGVWNGTTIDIAHGGTNSSTALNNNRVMISSGGAIVEAAAITANRALASNASGIPVASATTDTELGYVSGVTSSIQTQLNGKQATGNYITALTGDVTATGPGSVAATIANNAVTNAKLAQMPTLTLKGNNTGGTANASDLTVSQVNTMLGTVTSVTASSPLASSGGATPNISISNQNANIVLAGPTSGAAAAPTFRALVKADIPLLTTTTKTANYTITTSDDVIFCDTSGGAFTLTLPSPTGKSGMKFTIIDKAGAFNTNNLTLARSASEKIEGLAASKVLQTNWGWFDVITDGTDWYVG